MPKNVPKAKFLIITKAWRDMVRESYEDVRTCAMMGAIQKHVPDFFSWLEDQDSFQRVGDVKLREFTSTMREISKLGEVSLNRLIKEIELEKNDKKSEKKEESSREKEDSPDPDHSPDIRKT